MYIYEHVFNGWLMCQPFFINTPEFNIQGILAYISKPYYSIDMFLSILILGFGLTGLEVRRGFGVFIIIGVTFGVFFFFFGLLVGFGVGLIVGFGVSLIVAVIFGVLLGSGFVVGAAIGVAVGDTVGVIVTLVPVTALPLTALPDALTGIGDIFISRISSGWVLLNMVALSATTIIITTHMPANIMIVFFFLDGSIV